MILQLQLCDCVHVAATSAASPHFWYTGGGRYMLLCLFLQQQFRHRRPAGQPLAGVVAHHWFVKQYLLMWQYHCKFIKFHPNVELCCGGSQMKFEDLEE